MILNCLDKDQESLNCFEESLNINGNFSDALTNKGLILLKLNKNLKLKFVLIDALKINPLDSQARIKLEELRNRRKKYEPRQ